MPTTHIATSFEEYADGASGESNWQDTLVDPTAGQGYGWFGGSYATIPGITRVVSHDAATGVKSVELIGSGMSWVLQGGETQDRYIFVETSQKPNHGFGVSQLAHIQIASQFGTGGSTNTPILLTGFGPGSDLSLSLDNDDYLVTISGASPAGVYATIALEVLLSTVQPDGLDVNPDGYVRVLVNGVVVHDTGLRRVSTNTVTWASLENGWSLVGFSIDGYLDDVTIESDTVEPPPTLPPPDSTPCCGSDPDVPLGPNPGEILNPPLQPWERGCLGGGIVLSEADLVDAEFWVL